jgi:outer membrane lipoprotein-sorting protein
MRGTRVFLLLAATAGLVMQPVAQANEQPSGRDIVERCDFKYPGSDQKTRLTIVLRDKDGNEKRNVYSRFWKDYEGADGIADKMVLFTEFPPDAKGAGFMRWGYAAETGKNAEQWIYLPNLKRMRRVSVRDPGESFLGSDLTHFDIGDRDIDADEHTLQQSGERDGAMLFVVESVPRDPSKSLYSKVVSLYEQPAGNEQLCVKRAVDYYDQRGNLLKKQTITWQQVDGAWVWDEVRVQNTQNGHSSVFTVTDVEINTGIADNVFTERNLTRGP